MNSQREVTQKETRNYNHTFRYCFVFSIDNYNLYQNSHKPAFKRKRIVLSYYGYFKDPNLGDMDTKWNHIAWDVEFKAGKGKYKKVMQSLLREALYKEYGEKHAKELFQYPLDLHIKYKDFDVSKYMGKFDDR